MLIVADENMPLLDEFFGGMGTVRRVAGRALAATDLVGADVLLVRSVTSVDAALLGVSTPRFVGSATIGTDHVDLPLLAMRGIPFAASPGCNAVAVGEYVATVLALFAAREGIATASLRMGVVGCGHVGRAVVARGQALGLDVAVCDPLLTAATLPAGVSARPLDDLLAWADIISLHVPLTHTGPAPTWHLLDQARLATGRWRLLINSARGPVVDNHALMSLPAEHPERRVVLDVWEAEPAVPAALLARIWLGTPHVAGYSLEGKWRGTEMVYQAACRALGIAPAVTLATILQAQNDKPERLAWAGSLVATLAACCDVPGDDARLRAAVTGDGVATAQAFDRLRREYPQRREFSHYVVAGAPQSAIGLLAALGFGFV